MKKLSLVLILFAAFCAVSHAQHLTPAEKIEMDKLIASGAAKFSLSANKELLEPSEMATLKVRITFPPNIGADDTPTNMPEEVDFPNDGSVPYKIVNWRVVQGGGKLIADDNGLETYDAPATAPPDKTMLISVDLVPFGPNYPKVELLQTLYWVQNETAIYVNMPQIGLDRAKFVAKADGGVKAPTIQGMDPRAAAAMSPELRKQLEEAQAKVAAAQGQSSINLGAISSGAMVYYDASNNLSAVRFKSISEQMSAGHPATQLSAMFNFSFKGKGVGSYPLTSKDTGAGFLLLPLLRIGVECGNNNRSSSGKDTPCDGNVVITDMDDKVIHGTINTSVYTVDQSGHIYKGHLYGKFMVNRSN